MCQFFGVSRGGYYDFVTQLGQPEKDAVLAEKLRTQQAHCFQPRGTHNINAQNGQLALTVLDLRPYEDRFLIEDMQKVNSAYTKDREAALFFEKSDVLYADKKRAETILRRAGFQIPAGLLRYGSMGSISYKNGNVKLRGVPLLKIISTENPDVTQLKVNGSDYYDLLRQAGNTAQADALQKASEQYTSQAYFS